MRRMLAPVVVVLPAMLAVAASSWIVTRSPATVRPWVAAGDRAADRIGPRDTAASCAECHVAEFEAWHDSPHARTLVGARGLVAESLAGATPEHPDLGRLTMRSDRLVF
jgi:hypothetical protein